MTLLVRTALYRLTAARRPAVAGHVHAGVALVHHARAEPGQAVDHARTGVSLPGSARGQHHRVVRLIRTGARHLGQRRQRLRLRNRWRPAPAARPAQHRLVRSTSRRPARSGCPCRARPMLRTMEATRQTLRWPRPAAASSTCAPGAPCWRNRPRSIRLLEASNTPPGRPDLRSEITNRARRRWWSRPGQVDALGHGAGRSRPGRSAGVQRQLGRA